MSTSCVVKVHSIGVPTTRPKMLDVQSEVRLVGIGGWVKRPMIVCDHLVELGILSDVCLIYAYSGIDRFFQLIKVRSNHVDPCVMIP